MSTISDFNRFTSELKSQDKKMPVLFVGHGSPTNAIEDNEFSTRWTNLGKELDIPAAVLVISAHWLTRGTHITAMEFPKTIHDFGGFQSELYEVQYPAPGNPALAAETAALIQSTNVGLNHDWGLDHGAWSVVRRMYPDANIPVLQLSIDYYKPAQYHYDLAKELSSLRKKRVLILASGNMVHNLRMLSINNMIDINKEYGYDWAVEMNTLFKKAITKGDHKSLIEYDKMSSAAKLAVPTPDHYYPLIYAAALQEKNDEPFFFNDKVVAGSLTMTSVKFGA